jgi:hypothetical protein
VTELFFDHDYRTSTSVRHEKSRLFKCVDKKGNFLWWEHMVVDEVKEVDGLRLTLDVDENDFTSGYADFTSLGTQLELTEEDRVKALTRKVKL